MEEQRAANEGQRCGALRFRKKQGFNDGKGGQFEERVLALVYLRCLRRGLVFQLSANDADAGSFDDVVLRWRPEGHRETHALVVQLKHKSLTNTNVTRRQWLSRSTREDFALRRYCASPGDVARSLEADRATLVLLTNAHPAQRSLDLFERRAVPSAPGLELLVAGGELYGLSPDSHQAREAVQGNDSFAEHFHLLCNQSDSGDIVRYIDEELDALLGAGELCEPIRVRLCGGVRDWMNGESVCLTGSWDTWQALVDEYVQNQVTQCRLVTTTLKYRSGGEDGRQTAEGGRRTGGDGCRTVRDVWSYVESHNPAWVRPPERGTEALSATKIHQALVHDRHIMVPVEQFEVLRRKVDRCWGRFCEWLVIVDEEEHDHSAVLRDLVRRAEDGRRLVIVSSRENNGTVDICRSRDVSDDSWEQFLGASVRLNGERYRCRLRDLVAGAGDLAALLDGRPAALLTLARLAAPLAVGQRLRAPPSCYVPRRLAGRRRPPARFFSALRFPDVCVAEFAYYQFLRPAIGNHILTSFKELPVWIISPPYCKCPLFVLSDSVEAVRENARKWPSFKFYVLQLSDSGWKIRHFSGRTCRILEYPAEPERDQLEILDDAAKSVIVEGKAGVGKTEMVSEAAQQIKERDPTVWVLRVNLLEFYGVLGRTGDAESAAEEILKRTLFNEGELGGLEFALLRHALRNSRRVVCFVDGFDEVTPNYVKKCLEVLPLLAPEQGKLVVTTRPAALKLLEKNVGVLAHTLLPFSESELQDFFDKYTSTRTRPQTDSLNESLRDLLRIPLFAKMFADLLEERRDATDIVTLYEAFFENQFVRLFEEKFGDDLAAPGKETQVREDRNRRERQLMPLAASVLLRSSPAPAVSPSDREYLTKAGIVDAFADGRPTFVHRTFAEHFLAKWCFLGGRDREGEFREAYRDETLEFFRESFDRRAVGGRPLLRALLFGDEREAGAALAAGAERAGADAAGRGALHLLAAAGGRRARLRLGRLCARQQPPPRLLGARDRLLGWAPLRYAAEGGHWLAAKLLLEAGADLAQLAGFGEGRLDAARLRDSFRRGGYEALHRQLTGTSRYTENGRAEHTEFAVSLIAANLPRECLSRIAKAAWERGHILVCYLLLRAYCTMEDEEEEEGIWGKAARLLRSFGFRDEQPQDEPPEVFTQRNSSTGRATEVDSYLSLHRSVESGDWRRLRALIEQGADLYERDMFGCTAVHCAAAIGNRQCIKVLVEAGVDVGATSFEGSTALHFAARRGNSDCVRLLLELGADVNQVNADGATPLMCAHKSGNRECVTLLLKATEGRHFGSTNGQGKV